MLAAAKSGVSSHKLERQLDTSHESAWFMSHRIGYAFAPSGPQAPLIGTVEADETYIGDKCPASIPGVMPQDLKVPVGTLVERDGEARSQVMVDVNGADIREVLWDNIDANAHLMTGQSSLYKAPGKAFASHGTVDHSKDEYVRGNVYTNRAEGYFSQLKRSIARWT